MRVLTLRLIAGGCLLGSGAFTWLRMCLYVLMDGFVCSRACACVCMCICVRACCVRACTVRVCMCTCGSASLCVNACALASVQLCVPMRVHVCVRVSTLIGYVECLSGVKWRSNCRFGNLGITRVGETITKHLPPYFFGSTKHGHR